MTRMTAAKEQQFFVQSFPCAQVRWKQADLGRFRGSEWVLVPWEGLVAWKPILSATRQTRVTSMGLDGLGQDVKGCCGRERTGPLTD